MFLHGDFCFRWNWYQPSILYRKKFNLNDILLEALAWKKLKICPNEMKDFELKIKSWRKYTILKRVADNQKEDL